ncbi:hypothetical protein E2C01_008522 [Portunus trituberculatus]|uniref:Uncharacterized protein n=1 Tax=Portunus trituberculatus TaxID=210409 RepID=A0A5B7D105_PORTR|nr:hypothetical protein [Portunus trituberculatus]
MLPTVTYVHSPRTVFLQSVRRRRGVGRTCALDVHEKVHGMIFRAAFQCITLSHATPGVTERERRSRD